MDMQNVSNLQIPEGMVRTIHDKDNRLIWGAVGYDTKYAGNTYQQTYSGKNQLSYTLASLQSINTNGTWTNNVYVYNGITYTVNDDLTINVNGSTAANAPSYFMINNSLSLTSSTNYILNGCPSGGAVTLYSMRLYDGESYTSDTGSGLSFTYGTQNLVRINIFGGITVTNKLFKPMIRLATVTDDTYEKFVGGIPSPNPSFPQSIQVVTGTQTITIYDGTLSEDFTVDLGNTELCKIGTYQDYIYKSGNDWYIKKQCGRLDMSTITGWGRRNNGEFFQATFSTTYGIVADIVYSNIFTYDSTTWAANGKFGVSSAGALWIMTGDTALTQAGNVPAWLGNKNAIMYGILAVPTGTKITDTTLISQLNAIHEWLTRYGYSATVTGNLPIIIDQTPLA